MKHYYLLLLLFFVGALSSCSADSMSYGTVNDRIQGKWRVEKIEARELGGINTYHDVTPQYSGYTLEFAFDGYCEITDLNSDANLTGWWYLDEIITWDQDDQEEDVEYILRAEVSDTSLNITRNFAIKDLKVNNSRLKGKERKGDARFKYHFVKM